MREEPRRGSARDAALAVAAHSSARFRRSTGAVGSLVSLVRRFANPSAPPFLPPRNGEARHKCEEQPP